MSKFDLVISGVRLGTREGLCDIGIADGVITALAPGLPGGGTRIAAEGALAVPGLVETHIHLDKALILDRCPVCHGTLAEAVELTARAKRDFAEEDVYARAAQVIEMAILAGTNVMRSFVEVDPRVGLRAFNALKWIRADYGFAIDLKLCAFAQEGLTNEPETLALLEQGLANGADQIGGCPYMDPNPKAHIGLIFDLAERFDVDVDFHADFDLSADGSALPEIIAQTVAREFGGRVSVGHATKLSAMPPALVDDLARRLAGAGVSVTALPATDLFLNGRGHDHLVPRGVAPLHVLARHGVTTTIASNNILNPFTPYGDANLIRMANLFANVAQLSRDDDLAACFAMISEAGLRQLGMSRAIAIGASADLVLIDAPDAATAMRRIAQPLMGFKAGRRTFSRERGQIHRHEHFKMGKVMA